MGKNHAVNLTLVGPSQAKPGSNASTIFSYTRPYVIFEFHDPTSKHSRVIVFIDTHRRTLLYAVGEDFPRLG